MIKTEWKNNLNYLTINPNFLQSTFIKGLMFSGDKNIFINEIEWIETNYPTKLKLLQNPNTFGNPDLIEYKQKLYNPNDIHMAYHFLKYYNYKPFKKKIKIIEWGAGYGNLYKVIKLLFSKLIINYTIIDLPECIEMQKYYLSNLNLLDDKITFYSSLNLPKNIDRHDMFISTWAVSESPIECFNLLKNENFYGASKFLIALHQCGYHIPFMEESSQIFNYYDKLNFYKELIKIIPGINYYIFK